MENVSDFELYKLCPILSAEFGGDRLCEGPGCAWYDLRRECCAVLSIARQPEKK